MVCDEVFLLKFQIVIIYENILKSDLVSSIDFCALMVLDMKKNIKYSKSGVSIL